MLSSSHVQLLDRLYVVQHAREKISELPVSFYFLFTISQECLRSSISIGASGLVAEKKCASTEVKERGDGCVKSPCLSMQTHRNANKGLLQSRAIYVAREEV